MKILLIGILALILTACGLRFDHLARIDIEQGCRVSITGLSTVQAETLIKGLRLDENCLVEIQKEVIKL